MNNQTRHSLFFGLSIIILVLLFFVNLGVGSVFIPFVEIVKGFMGHDFSKKSWEIIVFQYRIPKAVTAVLAGVALSISGLQMQTFFRNPLAGPFVLGISSGAGLGVALLVLSGTAFGFSFFAGGVGGWAVVIAATVGAILVLLLMSLTAWKVKDSMTLLIVGLMFGSLAGAVISVLAYFSDADQLKVFTVWSMGSLGGTTTVQLQIFGLVMIIGLIPVLIFIKSYNAMLLGEAYAESMGVSIHKLRWAMIISTGILAGSATAFCGPIAFIGIAVPHMARLVFKTADHRVLFPASLILGAIVLLACDAISQLPGSAQSLPINAVTSLVGAPMVIWLILKRNFSKEF